MATICIVGANRGIGLALAENLVARGDDVICACRRTSSELAALGVRVITDIDVSDDAACHRLAQELEGVCLDGLIHNAGILARDSWDALNLEEMRRQFEVNTLGPLRVVRALHGHMAPQGKVAIITSRMGSIGDNTSGGYYGYRVSKCGVNMVSKSLALDLKEAGIAVAVLHPGYVQTEMTGGHGYVSSKESAEMLVAQFDRLSLKSSGKFFHANGEELPW
jgi:NAD(P)-dependent dehydrogenase (short-subunit alcohol dehydrogenase family)